MIRSFIRRILDSSYCRDILWLASGNGLAQVVGVLGIPILTRLYTPEDFAIQSLFLQVVAVGIGFMTWRYEYFIQLPKEKSDANRLFHFVIWFGLVTLVVSTIAIWYSRFLLAELFGNTELARYLVLAPLTALMFCYSVAFQNRAQRNLEYRAAGLSEVVGKVSYILFGMAAAPGSLGLIAAPLSSAVGKVVSLSLPETRNAFLRVKQIKYAKPLDIDGILRLPCVYGRRATSMVFSSLVGICTGTVPLVFISRQYGDAILGQYALVVATIFLPSSFVGAAIGQVFYQRAATLWSDGLTFKYIWRETSKRLIYFGFPCFSLIALVSGWAYPFVFGEAWEEAGMQASWMSIVAFCGFISSPFDRSSLIVGTWWYLPAWHILRAITTVFVALVAYYCEFSFFQFLKLLVAQSSAMYLIDYFAERYFASKIPFPA